MKKSLHIKRFLLWTLFPCLLVPGACNYSFTGVSISPEVKTVSIQYFENYATLGPPTLSQTFTETLKDLFIRQTNLNLVSRNGDLQFEGQITSYVTAPIAIQADDQAASNRLTITVDVKFVNTHDPTQNFETSFSKFADYDSNQNLTAVENELITTINDQLVQEIFNKSVGNW